MDVHVYETWFMYMINDGDLAPATMMGEAEAFADAAGTSVMCVSECVTVDGVCSVKILYGSAGVVSSQIRP